MQEITLSFSKLQSILANVIYMPHPEIHVGNLLIPTERRVSGNSTLFIAATANIDVTADVTLKEWCMIGHGAEIWTHAHEHQYAPLDMPTLRYQEECPKVFTTFVPKIIEQDVWIYKAAILQGCTLIARGSVIATGAVVTKPITETYGIWAGVPARRIGTRSGK